MKNGYITVLLKFTFFCCTVKNTVWWMFCFWWNDKDQLSSFAFTSEAFMFGWRLLSVYLKNWIDVLAGTIFFFFFFCITFFKKNFNVQIGQKLLIFHVKSLKHEHFVSTCVQVYCCLTSMYIILKTSPLIQLRRDGYIFRLCSHL